MLRGSGTWTATRCGADAGSWSGVTSTVPPWSKSTSIARTWSWGSAAGALNALAYTSSVIECTYWFGACASRMLFQTAVGSASTTTPERSMVACGGPDPGSGGCAGATTTATLAPAASLNGVDRSMPWIVAG